MIRRQQFFAAEILPLAAKSRNALRGFENGLCGSGAEANNHFGIYDLELADEIRRTGGDFIRFGLAIFWRTAFYDVANVNIFALQAHGFNHLRQQFPRATNERDAGSVFIGAGTFAHEDEVGVGIAIGKDDVFAFFVEFAPFTIANIFADFEERIVFNSF